MSSAYLCSPTPRPACAVPQVSLLNRTANLEEFQQFSYFALYVSAVCRVSSNPHCVRRVRFLPRRARRVRILPHRGRRDRFLPRRVRFCRIMCAVTAFVALSRDVVRCSAPCCRSGCIVSSGNAA